MLLGALLVVLTGVELVGACELDSAVVELATGALELVIELNELVVRGIEEVMIELVLFLSGMLLDVVWGIVALLVEFTGVELVGVCELDSAVVELAIGALELAIELDGPVVRGTEEVKTKLVVFTSGILLDVVSGIGALLVVLTTELMEVAGSDVMLLVLLTTGGISVGPMEVVGMASLLVVFEKIG